MILGKEQHLLRASDSSLLHPSWSSSAWQHEAGRAVPFHLVLCCGLFITRDANCAETGCSVQ